MNSDKKISFYKDEDFEITNKGIVVTGAFSLEKVKDRVGSSILKKAKIKIDLKTKSYFFEGDVKLKVVNNGIKSKIIHFFIKVFNIKHKHKWQDRGVNSWGITTYRICIKCRICQKRVNKPFQLNKFEKCEPKPYLDAQFNDKNEYIL